MAYATRQLHRMRGFGLLDYQNALILLRPLNGEFDPFVGYFRHFISFFQGNLSLYYFLTFYYFYEKKQTNK